MIVVFVYSAIDVGKWLLEKFVSVNVFCRSHNGVTVVLRHSLFLSPLLLALG